MQHLHDGHWRETTPTPIPAPELAGGRRADLVVVGGGFTGLWTALMARASGAEVVLLEAGRCGAGASTRNAGFCSAHWEYLELLEEVFGADGHDVALASHESWRRLRAWATQFDVGWIDADVHALPTTPDQSAYGDRSLEIARGRGISEELIADADRSLVPRGPWSDGGTRTAGGLLNPALLVDRLRIACSVRGVTIHEHSRVRRVSGGLAGVTARTDHGAVVAGALVLAMGSYNRLVEPLRPSGYSVGGYLTLSTPDATGLSREGWSEEVAVTDLRETVSYARRVDDRLLYGFGPGVGAVGLRPRTAVDRPRWAARTAERRDELFPSAPPIARWWSGLVDMSHDGLPTVGQLDDRVWYAHGYSGNGVGPSHWAAEWLSRRVTGGEHEDDRLPLWDRPLPATRSDGLSEVRTALELVRLRREERATERRWRRR